MFVYYNKCDDDQYQCYYGACVGKDKYYNNQRVCADVSDEPKLCGNKLTKSQKWYHIHYKTEQLIKMKKKIIKCLDQTQIKLTR